MKKVSMTFGPFGGQHVPEVLLSALGELEEAYLASREDPSFAEEMTHLLRDYVGRPSPLYFASRITKALGGAKVYLKREDLNHTGAHKINNVLGQALLAKRMGKKRVIAETGAGMHGVATATAAALFDLECVVYMGEEDVRRQAPNVARMKLLGAEVVPVTSGTRTLADAVDEAIAAWVGEAGESFYLLGSVVGPHPYPLMVREFQKIIGEEAKAQILEKEGRLPDQVVACVGGGSNAMGIFHAFVEHPGVALVGVEAAGKGVGSEFHAATLTKGKPGVLHGSYSYVLYDENGEVQPAYSISAGLDYPGVGPEHSHLAETGRASYVSATDDEAVDAFLRTCRLEGIIPALESSHALAHVYRSAGSLPKDHIVLANLSGRGDKDMDTILSLLQGK